MLTYRRFDHLEIIGFFDFNFVGCIDSRRSTSGYDHGKEGMCWIFLGKIQKFWCGSEKGPLGRRGWWRLQEEILKSF